MAIGFSYISDRAFALSDLDGTGTRQFTPFFNEDEVSYAAWLDDVKEKASIDNPFLPLVYPYSRQAEAFAVQNSDGSIGEFVEEKQKPSSSSTTKSTTTNKRIKRKKM